jgi:NTP pyrophosphatase (non-canonical NTP hydrolase)
MEARLRRHDDKRVADGWKGETLDFLFDRLQAEVDELQVARLPGAIAEEAADVANYAMMIADVAGGLSDRTVRVLQQRRATAPGTNDGCTGQGASTAKANATAATPAVGPEPRFATPSSGTTREAANVTRLPSSGPDPALVLLAKAQEVVSADIAYRLQLEDRCERLAELVERLEAKVRELEGETGA